MIRFLQTKNLFDDDMKRKFFIVGGLLAAAMVFVACNKTPTMSSNERALFENATPEVKQLFQTAWAADKANDYVSASSNYQALLRQQLSVDQIIAMQTAMKSLTLRMQEAAAKGDAAAVKAMESARKGRGQ